jgi:hypothetical protein
VRRALRTIARRDFAKSMKKIFIIILFTLCFLPTISFAADMSFNADKNIFNPNEDFIVQVYLDTKNASVNAVEGTVIFSPDFLTLKEIRDGNSSINFWIDKPHILTDGKIIFSGITAGGFSGPHRFLFGLVLEAKNNIGDNSVAFSDVQVLQNDGLGTKIPTNANPFSFSISKGGNGSSPENLKINDTGIPEDFTPFVANDPTIFDGKSFLVFSTVDKISGIDHYEVRESFFGWDGRYIEAVSPYLLNDQTLKSRIYVKAVDKAGNERIVTLGGQNRLWLFLEGLIIVIIIIICALIWKKIRPKFTR